MSSRYVDTTSVLQVIGNVFNNPSLLDAGDKYVITEDDFDNEFHKIVFGCIYKVYELGAKKVTLENINDFLSMRPKSEAIYRKEKGDEWLLQVSESAISEGFDYYYNRMKKFSLLRAFDKLGIDVSFIYDPDNILDSKKKQLQEEQLDNTPIEELANKVTDKVEAIKAAYVDSVFGEAYQAGEEINDLIERLKETPEVGIPMYGPLINTVTRGARLRKMYLRSAPTGAGKAIPNNTTIPTPQGYRLVKDIKEGDYLFGQDGKPTKVLKVYPQAEKKQIYEVKFLDGRVAKCCKDHLWEYAYDSHSGIGFRTESAQEIIDRTLKLKNGFRNSDKGYRFKVKLNKPVQYPERKYSVDPYVMGALVGDGSFRYDNSNKALTFSSRDDELPSKLSALMGNYVYHKNSEHNYNYTFKPKDNLKHNLWVEEIFKDYPQLWNIKSEDKQVPEDYLLGSIEQRYDLLQGLLDTDGSIDDRGRINFTTVSKVLRDQVIELCHSLGMVTSYMTDTRAKYTTGECYTVHIQCKKEIKPRLFRLEFKLLRAKSYAASNKRSEYKEFNSIVDIKPTDEWTDMTCFTVDNDDSLFLMNDFIVTHNTRTMIADACYFACNEIYDEMFGWIKNGTSEPTLYISTEQEKEEIQTMMLAFLSAVNEEHILNGTYVGDEEERVLHAAEIISKAPLYIEELPDFSLKDVEDTIKKNIREHDVKYVCHDYIMTSLKILEEVTKRSGGVKLREDNILFMLSRRLKDLANKYGVFILSATQLNGSYQDSETPDQNLLRGAKSIADSIDLGMILLPVRQNDLDSLESVLASNAFEKPNLKISVYKNRRGRYKGVYLWCRADLGTCRVKPMFCTDYMYEVISIEDLKIMTEERSAF